MKIQQVSFNGNLAKGRAEFEKLPLSEKVALKSIENFRQKFNANNLNPIPAKQTDLADYVRYAVSIENIVKKKANEIFGNLRRSLGV